jgi:hypothetical protein
VSTVNPNWIVLTVFTAAAVVTLVTSRLQRCQVVDLGGVSHQWMAEHRFGQGHDSESW